MRETPLLYPDDLPPHDSHFCERVGSRVYAPVIDCPYCSERGESSCR